MIALIFALPLALAAAPLPAGLQPLAFLTGYCWQGQLPTPGQVDRHCFAVTADGAIRDHHVVSDRGNRLLAGESLYRWDAAKRAITVTYRDTMGGRSSGIVRTRGAMFGIDTRYVLSEGARITVQARWTRIGDTAFRADLHSPDAPQIDRRVIYRRVG